MMLSHLCQARLWTRPERKAITGAITNDTPHQLKTWPVLNNAIGGICHTEVLNAKETKTDYILYSRENAPSSVTVPIQANSWNLKENNGNIEENHQVFPVNCSFSQISENPAYGLTPVWIDNVQSRYISDDSSTEMKSTQDEQEYNIYGGTTESECSSETKEEVAEVDEKIRPELKYSINSNKIEHIKHYLQSSSSNHFDFKPKHCRKVEISNENCEGLSSSEKLEEIKHPDSLMVNEHFTCRDWKQSEATVNSTIRPHANTFNLSSSSNNICSHQEFTSSHLTEKKQKPSLDKLQCGSTFLSQTNRPQYRTYELPFHSNNLVTEQVSEQTLLWTESHLPSSNQNHRHNAYFNNDWYQLALPKYQKLPLQKNSTPSPIPSQKVTQNVSDILQKSSRKNPANISMVIMQCTYLHSHPKENSSVKDIALPMGSLVAALYKESEWLYVQTPHGEKGFVTFSNCMALGTLTDEYFALTNGLDNLGNAEDSESSDEESESEQLVSMEPLQETNYSKLAEVKANCGSNLQKNNMEKIFSMITKHGLGQINFFDDQNCDNEESNLLNSKALRFSDMGKNEMKNVNCGNIQDNCRVLKDNSLRIPKNCFKDTDKMPHDLGYESTSSLQDLHVGNAEITIAPEKVTNEHPNASLLQNDTYLDHVKCEDMNIIKRNTDKLNILDGSERTNKACDNYFSTADYSKDIDDRFSLSISVNQDNKAINNIFSVSSILNQGKTTYVSSDENSNNSLDKTVDASHCNFNVDKVQNIESLSNTYDSPNMAKVTTTNCTKTEIPIEERIKIENENDLKCLHNMQCNHLHNNDDVCSSGDSKCTNVISEKEETLITYKNDNSGNCKTASTILAIIENYGGKEEGTLSVKKGDLVTVLNIVNSEWMWVSSANGIEGYIPSVCTSQVGIF